MKKLFTLLTLALISIGSAWADEAVLSIQMGKDGAEASQANSITGASGCAAEGFTIAITGNTTKNWSAGNGSITLGTTTYKTLKNSNGAQNTITCPSGKVATQVVFYAVANADEDGKLSEFAGASCTDAVSSHKDYTAPTVITKSIDNKASFTFTFSSKQVCFIAVVTYTDAASDVVADPTFSLDAANLTMSCVTGGATIHYSLDGSEPTASSPAYSTAITLENSCTVRARAFKGESNEYSSEIVKKDCYVSHASAIDVLGYNGGTVEGDVWSSTDGFYTLTNNVAGRGINYVNLAGSQDGFKLNHTDSYVLQPTSDVKITKIVVVGKSWLQGDAGNASTIAFDGFTPTSGIFYDYLTDGETYVKTIEFTPTSELAFGDAVTIRPGNNQLGAYIEIYGEKRKSPAKPETVKGTPVTWDFSTTAAQTAAGTITASASNTLTATDGVSTITYVAGSSDKYDTDGFLKPNGKSTQSSGTYTDRYFCLNIATSGKISFVGASTSTKAGNYVILQGSAATIADATEKGTVVNTATDCSYDVNISDGEYVFVAFGSQIYTASLTWTPALEDITLTTTDNMDGWRTFYDASNDYSVDSNTKVYVVASDPVGDAVSLTPLSGVPAGVPVILHTTSSADSHKMTLTKEADGTYTYTAANKLVVTIGGETITSKYRLGYNSTDGVGFYPYSTASAAADVIYLDVSSVSTSRTLAIDFDDATGIDNVTRDALTNGKVYNLQGQEVKNATKGIFIVNGKKVILK